MLSIHVPLQCGCSWVTSDIVGVYPADMNVNSKFDISLLMLCKSKLKSPVMNTFSLGS